MTYEEKVRWLRRYRDALRLEEELRQELEAQRARACKTTAALTGNIGELPHVADADGAARGKQDKAQAGLQGFSFHDSINSLFPICSAGRAHRAGQSVAFVL